ncbi:MAG TPA: SRPBCC family protein [Kofleriaceae bacterium]|nr:SRPBCC family protein [Kofleriaceae bacterium]
MPYPVARVYAAFADPKLKARWFKGPPGWEENKQTLDFKVGGLETSVGRPPGGPRIRMEGRFYDIVPEQRIVSAYEMWIGDSHMSVSLATTVFERDGDGTKMIFTEQAVYLDGNDGTAGREQGTRGLFDALEASLR